MSEEIVDPKLPTFNSSKKKKSKFFMDSFSREGTPIKEKEVAEAITSSTINFTDMELDFSFDLKKKKKKTTKQDEESTELIQPSQQPSHQVFLSDQEYKYEELLDILYAILRKKDPSYDQDGKKKLVMKPPQILRVGSKKTSFVNFFETSRLLHRSPKHLQSFLLVELGTSGSVDGNNQLVIKGRFDQKQIEAILRRYIKEYVTCHTCKSPDTLLQKDIRLCFLQCESCGSRCSVASVKSGYQAVTAKRAALRAKEAV